MNLSIAYAILAIVVINIFIWKAIAVESKLLRLAFHANVAIAINCICALVVLSTAKPSVFISSLLPLMILGGAFSYLICLLLIKGNVKTTTIYGHLTLPIMLIIGYPLIALIDYGLAEQQYLKIVRFCAIVLIGGYLFAIVKEVIQNREERHKALAFFACSIIVMPLLAIVSTVVLMYKHEAVQPEGFLAPDGLLLINYLIVLFVALVLFRFLLHELLSKSARFSATAMSQNQEYLKSPLKPSDMAVLASKIEGSIAKGIYLKQGLSLNDLARAIHEPNHYVTQTINVQMKSDFHQLINSRRIERACTLLLNTTKNIEEIWIECGFNSRTSFNRQFRAIVGITPSSYRMDNALAS